MFIDHDTAARLRTHRTAQLRPRLTAGDAWEDHDLVFRQTTVARGTPTTCRSARGRPRAPGAPPIWGAANGNGNARSVTRILAPVARAGTAAQGQFLKPETISLIFDQQSNGTVLVNGPYLC